MAMTRYDGASRLVVALWAIAAAASCSAPARPPLIPADYGEWRSPTDARLDYPIPGHEDRFRVIRMNELGFGYARSADGSRVEFPDGTIIAKDIYATRDPAPDERPAMVTAMVKAPADPDARGGWVWVVKDAASGTEAIQTGDFCVRCHANANEPHPYGSKNPGGAYADYVFYVPFDR